MTPYQFYFYSSGAIEDEWSGEDLLTNRITSLIGSVFGAMIDFALIVIAAVVLFPQHAGVQQPRRRGAADQDEPRGDWIWLLHPRRVRRLHGRGVGDRAQRRVRGLPVFRLGLGQEGPPRQAPLFHLGYLIMFVVAMILAYTHVDPIRLTVLTMAFGAFSLPFTFLPLLVVANDADYMGEQKNTVPINIVAGIMLALLTVVTIAAIPLFIMTGGGS